MFLIKHYSKRSGGGVPLLARWTEDFDCGYETEWWYVIKDTPLDLSKLKKKRRYEINKGNKNFDVKVIDAKKYIDEIISTTKKAYKSWPEKYRPNVNQNEMRKDIIKWDKFKVFGCIDKETKEFCGYALITEHKDYAEFNVLRVDPQKEKRSINAAIVFAIVKEYENKLSNGFYINDGSRAIRHETAFQDYLEKYFEFRKAYCKLAIKYRFPINIIIKILFPFRNIITKDSKLGSLIYSLLNMEKMRRNCQ